MGKNRKRMLVAVMAAMMVLSMTACAEDPADDTSSSEPESSVSEQVSEPETPSLEIREDSSSEVESETGTGTESETSESTTDTGSSAASQSAANTTTSQPAADPGSQAQQPAAQQSSTPAPQKTTATSGKGPLAKYTVNVSDSSTPAVKVVGETINGVSAYYFYSDSGKLLGNIPFSYLTTIIRENDLSYAEADEQKAWFVENFNIYRGLDGDSGTNGGSSSSNTNGGSSSSSDIDIEEYRDEVFKLVNEAREAEGLEPFVSHSTAMEFAQIRAEEISENFSHTRPDGSVMTYSHYNFAENIAKGGRTPEDAVNSWLTSSGHRAAIMADYSNCGNGMGVGIFEKNGTMYWVLEFVGWDSEG